MQYSYSCNVNDFLFSANPLTLFCFVLLLAAHYFSGVFISCCPWPYPALVLFYSALLLLHRPDLHTTHLSTLSPFYMSQSPAIFPSLTQSLEINKQIKKFHLSQNNLKSVVLLTTYLSYIALPSGLLMLSLLLEHKWNKKEWWVMKRCFFNDFSLFKKII